MERYLKTMESPIGLLTLESNGAAITALRFNKEQPGRSCPVLEEAAWQLAEYFSGRRREFDLPLLPRGTAFQRGVWAALLTIPYGETASYGQIAAQIGNPHSCRAVGMANHRNPLPIFIPCHRVVGADGSLTGYAGGLEIKAFLLSLEQSRIPLETGDTL